MRLLRKAGDVPKRSLWQKIKDVALMDVAVIARGGVSAGSLEQLEQYFAGERREFDLNLELAGPAFHQHVWEALTTIPYGETRSYGEIAAQVGDPGAARAVGFANGRNPIAIVVPCHRVIGADGSLTGYGGGLPRKRHLLDLEAGRLALTA